MRILNWKNKDGHTHLCFGKFNTLDLLFFCSVPYVTVSVRIIARLACNLGETHWTPLITKTAKMIKMAWVFSGFNQHWSGLSESNIPIEPVLEFDRNRGYLKITTWWSSSLELTRDQCNPIPLAVGRWPESQKGRLSHAWHWSYVAWKL